MGPRLGEGDSVGAPHFAETGYYSGISFTDWSWAALLMDADQDGYKDLMVTNGLPKDITDLDFIAYREQNANTSVTAQRGALDWKSKFKEATVPVFEQLYESVASGKEAARVIAEGSKADYREKLEKELQEIRESELWQAGAAVRKLRPNK
mgnify:CR=1 FL=1